MADDDDDLGGGTLVMSPEERPPITGAAPKAVPPPPTPAADPQTIDDSWDSDAPGTFIMNPGDHTTAPTPASPFADSKERGSWPMAQVVVGPEPKQPGFAHAQTLMGGMQVMEEAEAIMAQRELEQQQLQQQQAQQMPMQMPMPQGHEQMMGFPSQPQLPQHSPMQGLSPNEPFPSPGFYAPDSTIEPQQKPGLGPLLLGAGVGLLTVTIVVGGYYGYRAVTAPSGAPSASAGAVVSGAPPSPAGSAVPVPATAQTSAATATATVKATASAAPALPPANAGSADAEARAALEKLGAGIKSCVATTIGKLPGTAPAVPSSLTWLK